MYTIQCVADVRTLQAQFEDMWSRFQTYSSGEVLFGLPSTDHPSLHTYRKELTLLQKLYGLYNAVMLSIDGYYDIHWEDVDIDKINNELSDFQNRYETTALTISPSGC